MTFLLLNLFLVLFAGLADAKAALHQNEPYPLYKSVFYSYIPSYSAANLTPSAFPKPIRARIQKYIVRTKSFRSRIPQSKIDPRYPQDIFIVRAGYEKQKAVEQAIVALIDHQGIENIAAKYAAQAVLYYEWEGQSEPPLDEADHAERYLNKNPKTPIAPYLILFLLHRYRSAYECLDHEKNTQAEEFQKKANEQEMASKKYRSYLRIAEKQRDPLIRMIAEEIDAESYLYIKTEKHP